jgi:hypothetical protein
VLTSLQALLRLATLRWLGVLICALATLLTAASTASALEATQTKTSVWGFDFADNNSAGLFQAASSGKHQGNQLARAEAASGSLLAAEGGTLRGGANGVRVYGPYGELPESGFGGFQRHHLNQDAAFNPAIPHDEGVSTYLHGGINSPGTEHFAVHARLERFWNAYRGGGALEGSLPTVQQYTRAAYRGLREAGLPQAEARALIEEAIAQQRQFGLGPTDLVPRLPNPIGGQLGQIVGGPK